MSRYTDKLRTIPLDDTTHRRLRVHVHATESCEDMGEALARVGSAAINAWIDAREAPPDERALDGLRRMGEREAGDPSEGAGEVEMYGRWRR